MRSTFLPIFIALILAATVAPRAVAHASANEQLSIAIVSSDVALARSAIQAGADVNADLGDGRTPLIVAAMSTKPLAVKLLLEHGADPNRRAVDGAIGNALTAAFFAMNGARLTGRVDEPEPAKRAEAMIVLRLIAASHPDFDVMVSRGPTRVSALMIAAEAGAPDVAKVLLDAGASPNFANDGRFTAIDYAVARAPVWSQSTAQDRVEVARLLLAAGAQPLRKSADGLNSVERARKSGNAAMVAMLTAAR
ncbi:MAG TPA: ankyrin repeat domain-containing protein [Povalibacter sp.]|uniref:ankyrin repeat domain-containing protein n=1 Tax=Povalibacter sp. TaxID=1962978 RepID=UPI002B95FD0A|nr:ankyrin repeat domain-containing protein [Povalibacter sp.]HMN45993.1 ankyrin repeat domain-containing protein [Povalibacter sp.]